MENQETNWTRRQFMAMGTLATMQFISGCAPAAVAIEGKPPHHTTQGFQNYPPAPRPENPGFSFLFRRIKESFNKVEVPDGHFIGESAAISGFNSHPESPSLTWIGHTTYLMRLEKKNILFDPFFSELASPLPVGPARYVQPAIPLNKLPAIDAIVVSHNHYDHLDSDAVENLPRKDRITVFVPLGLKPFFTSRGYKKIVELDWYQFTEWEGIRLTALPAVHFSSRSLTDRNETLWCSWAIHTSKNSCFFAGDTGYSATVFKEIGSKFKGFDIAIVPIGAYEPIKTMKPVHTNPEEAIQVANDVKADLIIPCHWGTIILTDEPPFEPPERYRSFAVKNGISDNRASVLKVGETKIL